MNLAFGLSAAPSGGGAPSGGPMPEAGEASGWLVRLAERRDRAAFALLFRQYAPRLKQFFLGRGQSDQGAEELVQEVMLRLWRKAEQFDPRRGPAGAWIFVIARSCLLDDVRRRRRAEIIDGDAEPPPTEAGEPGDRRDLSRALATLPAEQAEVIMHSYYRGLSLAEIAVDQKVPLGTVKTRARLALARLRQLFGNRRSP
jgi:RNA polymerase sigma-70 factor (ECF subfamily)